MSKFTMHMIAAAAAMLPGAFAQNQFYDSDSIGSCSAVVISPDGDEYEDQRKCEMFESEEDILSMRPMGTIYTGSGYNLQQHPELMEWLVDEQYKKYANLDLEVVRGQDPILEIKNSRTGKVQTVVKLEKHASKEKMEALLAKWEFEREG